jgi:Reverse transcriptase (RNA-dependent DNA polymerase)/gag-polypeptide of LTR copia-type/GAG-pre-integrase domain
MGSVNQPTMNSGLDSTTLQVPKLRDDGSNWSDYQPRIERALGSKGLWRHVLGTAITPQPYMLLNGVPVIADGKTPATEDQIESKEVKIIEHDKREYLAQHVILSTTSARLGNAIKHLKTAKEMWDAVNADATTKSTLYILDAEDQLSSMKLADNDDPKVHLSEMKQHFQLMLQRQENLLKMGSTLSDTRFNTIVMTSLPESYRPTLQTITAAERASALTTGSSSTSKKMKASDMIAFLIEEAQHRVITDERTKNSELALAAQAKKPGKKKSARGKGKDKAKSEDADVTCDNCHKPGHKSKDCWSKGGGKEGQGPRQKKKKSEKSDKTEKADETAVVANDGDDGLFAFTCTSDYKEVANAIKVPKSRMGGCVDSGASRDYSPDREKFSNYQTIDRDITTADGSIVKAIGMGDLHIDLPNGSKRTAFIFKNAVHSPDLAFTLISVRRLDNAGYTVTFGKGMCQIMNKSGRTIATIPHSDGLYRISTSKEINYANVSSSKISIDDAHRKLGHISCDAIKHAITKGYILGIELDPESKPGFCEACAKAKSAREPFPKASKTRATKYGERVHWDLWGPAAVKSINGHSYVAARIDDATRETKLYFQDKKSQTFDSYKKDEAFIETQTGNRIKTVRSDRGGEFQSTQMINHQDQRGTVREFTVHDSPPQNGVAERGMRTRTERARALLISSGLPRFLWEEAMRHVTWLQNRSPARALDGKTPYEMVNNKKPHLGGIQEFGVAAYVKDLKAGKLDARAQLGRFVGYDTESKGYRIYWPGKRSVTVERNVVFNEKDLRGNDGTVMLPGGVQSEGEREKIIHYPETAEANPEKDPVNEDQPENKGSEDEQNASNTIPFPSVPDRNAEPDTPGDENTQQYGRGHRPRKVKGAYKDINDGLTAAVSFSEEQTDVDEPVDLEEVVDDDDGGYFNYYDLPPDFAMVGYSQSDPKTLDEALRGPNAKEWQKALDYEINQLEKLGTWVVETLPHGETVIPCSEVVKVKRGPSGEVQSYRVRIVAGGHRQVEGVNYTETFSAAAKMPTVRVVLANAAQQDWEIEHIDVKSAYLNAPLKEVIYMKPPRGVLKPGEEGKVLRLLKGLYGLKQAGRGWYLEMSRVFLKELGFKRSAIDHSVFYRREQDEHTIVAVATDDMAVTSKRAEHAKDFKSKIKRFWEITDHGPIKWFLGFQIKRDRKARTISINQQAYIESMVEKFRLTGAKAVATPMETNAQFTNHQSPSSIAQVARMKGVPYSEAIGSVLWPVVVSRPDAAYAVGILSQFIQNPGQAHWEAVKRVISYLGSTKTLWLTFGGTKETLVEGYCDADWASQSHRHSISGFSFHYGCGAVSWSSKKQNVIALSSTEAEYIAQTHAAKEAIWLHTFINEIRGGEKGPLTIMGDNQGAIALAKDNKFHSRTKHIDLRYHFIREAVDEGRIAMKYVPTSDNVADIFTKALAKPKFKEFVELLGLGEMKA